MTIDEEEIPRQGRFPRTFDPQMDWLPDIWLEGFGTGWEVFGCYKDLPEGPYGLLQIQALESRGRLFRVDLYRFYFYIS